MLSLAKVSPRGELPPFSVPSPEPFARIGATLVEGRFPVSRCEENGGKLGSGNPRLGYSCKRLAHISYAANDDGEAPEP